MSKLVGVSAHQSLRSVTLETQWGCQPTGRKVDAVEAGGGVSPPVVEKWEISKPSGGVSPLGGRWMMCKLVGVSAHQSLRSGKSQNPVGVSAHWEEGG